MWVDLGAADAAQADRAMTRLTAAPAEAIRYLFPNVDDPLFNRYDETVFFTFDGPPRSDMRRVIRLLREEQNDAARFEHARAWTSNPYGAEIITVLSEELAADPVRQLGRVCELVGLQREADVLEQAVVKARSLLDGVDPQT